MGTKAFAALVSWLAVAGCSQEAPSVPGQPAVARPHPVGSATDAGAGQTSLSPDAAVFSMTPDSIRACGGGNGGIVSTAKWDVTAQRIHEVAIYVIDAKGERKLWLAGGAKGEATTGKWVFPDSTFRLVGRKSGETISEIAIRALPCS